MSQVTLSGDTSSPPTTVDNRICKEPTRDWEAWWVWGSEQLNPIVVKEVRQSLKSKQFTISFGLTLIAAVAWTLFAVSLSVPRIYFMPSGETLLAGFFSILALPLMVIIPFSAFRSMTAETEDSTFELLSISALSAEQIVRGKMASSVVQILLYLSALAPCIVLTYLLRGVGLFTILFTLGLTVAFSIGETAIALLAASLSRTRLLQTGTSVVLLGGLLWAFFLWIASTIETGLSEFSNPPPALFLAVFAMGTILAATIAVILNAAAAAIDFPSENHSTPLRWRLLGLAFLTLFWSMLGYLYAGESEVAIAILLGYFIVMMAIGGQITGELGIISQRAQRTLPKTLLGRVVLTWLYPGAGFGYVYLVCMYIALMLTLSAVDISYGGRMEVVGTGYLLLCYLIIYVGLNRLLMLAVPRTTPARSLASICMLIVLLMMAHLVPWVIVFYLNDYNDFPYAWHQASNIYLSFLAINDRFSPEIGLSVTILTLCAMTIFGLNLILCSRDVMLVRVMAPPRVRLEDEASAAAPHSAPSVDPFAE
jgi:hypothetical protein